MLYKRSFRCSERQINFSEIFSKIPLNSPVEKSFPNKNAHLVPVILLRTDANTHLLL